MFSSTLSARASIGNGGGSALRSTSTWQSPSSTSPGRQVLVDRALGTLTDDTGDTHYVLGAHVDVVVDHALGDARVIAQVDEGEMLAVFAAASDPAGHGDGLADVVRAELAARCVRIEVACEDDVACRGGVAEVEIGSS